MHKTPEKERFKLPRNSSKYRANTVDLGEAADIAESAKRSVHSGFHSAFGSDLTVHDALRMGVLKECSESPLGTCLIAELGRFVEVLDLYPPIADFPIEQIFKASKREVGMPNSVIQQGIKRAAEAAAWEAPP